MKHRITAKVERTVDYCCVISRCECGWIATHYTDSDATEVGLGIVENQVAQDHYAYVRLNQ